MNHVLYRFYANGELVLDATFMTDDLRDREIAAKAMLNNVRGQIPGTQEWQEVKLEEWVMKQKEIHEQK